jgi:hypothetical protein
MRDARGGVVSPVVTWEKTSVAIPITPGGQGEVQAENTNA